MSKFDDYMNDLSDQLGVARDDSPDRNCVTLPNGECVSEVGCMHSPPEVIDERTAENSNSSQPKGGETPPRGGPGAIRRGIRFIARFFDRSYG